MEAGERQRRVHVLWQQTPLHVQLDDAVVTDEREGAIERRWQYLRIAEAVGEQSAFGPHGVRRIDHDIEVGKLPKRQVAVQSHGPHRPLDGDCRDVLGGEHVHDPDEVLSEDEVTPRGTGGVRDELST